MQDGTVISAGWLIDGTGGPIQRDVRVRIEQDRVVSVEKGVQGLRQDGKGMDFSGCTLLPGLVDTHVHLFMSGTRDARVRRWQLKASFREMKGVIGRHLRAQLAHGVAALRDGGDYAAHALRFKEDQRSGAGEAVFLKAAGRAWHAPGRYGALIGRPAPEGRDLAASILRREEAIDHVKVVNSGLNSLKVFGRETPPQFGIEELTAAVQAGRSLGLKTMVHANGKEPVRLCLEAGCHSVEHGFFMGAENLRRMADEGVTWVPTVFTMKAYVRMLPRDSLGSEIAERNLDHQMEQIVRARAYGVTVAAGTDSGSLGVDHGPGMKEEIRMLMEAGFSLSGALRCAGADGARLLGLEGEVGRVVPGMPATFLVTEGGPEGLPDALERPKAVYVAGRLRYAGNRGEGAWDFRAAAGTPACDAAPSTASGA